MRGPRRMAAVACWLAVGTAYVAAILPQRDAPHLGASDKVDHMAAFLAISVLARIGYRRVPVGLMLIVIAAFGGLIELTQALPFIHRDAEWGDWIADVAATAIGLTAAWPLLILADRRASSTP